MDEQFARLWTRLEVQGSSDEVFNSLIDRYREPHRRYHDVSHLEFGLMQLAMIEDLAAHPDWVEFAFFFHDSIYEIGVANNELQSANLAMEVLRRGRISDNVVWHIGQLILVTKPIRVAATRDEHVITDIDLAILGQPWNDFARYEYRVRDEYAVVPDDVFWKARIDILKGFLERQFIFSTHRFRTWYEERARANLKRSISSGENIINRI